MSDIEIATLKEQMRELKSIFMKMDNKIDELYKFNIEYNSKELICKENFDKRYILIDDFDHLWKEKMELFQTNNINNFNNKANLFKNVINIIQMLTPYVIMFFALK